jgi:hypothetical protein
MAIKRVFSNLNTHTPIQANLNALNGCFKLFNRHWSMMFGLSGRLVKGNVEYRSPEGARICRESPLTSLQRPKARARGEGEAFTPSPLPIGEIGGFGGNAPKVFLTSVQICLKLFLID